MHANETAGCRLLAAAGRLPWKASLEASGLEWKNWVALPRDSLRRKQEPAASYCTSSACQVHSAPSAQLLERHCPTGAAQCSLFTPSALQPGSIQQRAGCSLAQLLPMPQSQAAPHRLLQVSAQRQGHECCRLGPLRAVSTLAAGHRCKPVSYCGPAGSAAAGSTARLPAACSAPGLCCKAICQAIKALHTRLQLLHAGALQTSSQISNRSQAARSIE